MPSSQIARVVLWMTGTLLSFSALAVSIRLLSRDGLSTFEVLAVRSGTGLIVLLLLLAVRPQLRPLVRLRSMKMHLLRNCIHFASQYAWAFSLTLLPLATVFALEFTMPAWTVLFAVWLLDERLTRSRIGVVVLGLIGVLIILRPGYESVNPAAFLVLGAAVGYSIAMIATKMLTRTVSTFAIIFWMMAIQLPLSLAGSDPLFLAKLGTADILPVIGCGLSGLSSHYCLSNAFRSGDATLVVPLDFLRIPLIAVVGWIFFGEPLDIFVFIGAAFIISGVIWNLRAEAARTPLGPVSAVE